MNGAAGSVAGVAGAGRRRRRARVTLRPARPGEEALLSDLAVRSKGHWGHNEAFLAQARIELTLHPGDLDRLIVRVADRDGAVVGFSAVDLEEAELAMLFVDPPAIGTGVGGVLLRDALEHCGLDALVIQSDPDAEPFYVRAGARRIGTSTSPSTGRELPLLRISAPAPRRGE